MPATKQRDGAGAARLRAAIERPPDDSLVGPLAEAAEALAKIEAGTLLREIRGR